MTLFPSHTLETAPAEARPLLEETVQEVGFLPNLDAQLAEVPTVLQAYSWLGDQFDKTSLSAIERQVVLLAVAVEKKDEFSVAAHSHIARAIAAMDERCIRELRQGRPLSDAQLDALATFTREVVRSQGRAHDMPLAAFLGAGYNLKQALEVLLGVTLITMGAYASHLMNTTINSQLDPDQWQARQRREFSATAAPDSSEPSGHSDDSDLSAVG
jgi:alkylhydroperoxidase family enzyme